MANLSNINNILRVSSSGVGLNKNNTGPSELDIESSGADMIDMTRTGQKTYRFAISGASAFSLFDVAANADRLIIDSSGNVEIGANYTNAKLSVGGNLAILNTKQLNLTGTLDSDLLWYGMRYDNNEVQIYTYYPSDRSITFNTVSGGTGITTQLMKIETGGNVGIGTDSPTSIASGYTSVTTNGTNGGGLVMQVNGTATGYLYAESGALVLNNTSGVMQFYNAGSERMRINSSGQLLIETTTSQTTAKLGVRQNGSAIEFGHDNQSVGYYGTLGATYSSGNPFIAFRCFNNQTIGGNNFATQGHKGNVIFSESNGDLVFGQATTTTSSSQPLTERMRIDSSGYTKFTKSTGGVVASFYDGTYGVDLAATATGASIQTFNTNQTLNFNTYGTGYITFTTSGTSERMRITSAGDVLVGKTSNTIATSGAKFGATTGSNITRSSNEVLYLNRTTNFGKTLSIAKDGTTIGEIGTYSGVPYIGYSQGGGGGIMFNGLNIEPTALGSSRSSNTNDIGSASYKWKNVYLGGGVYLGGTATANLLDDYEEGTFQTNIDSTNVTNYSYSGQNGRYTKIGRQVIVTFIIDSVTAGTGFKYFVISNLPFVQHTASHDEQGYCNNYPRGERRSGIIINNSSGSNNTWYVGYNNNSSQSGDRFRGTIIYTTT